MNKYLVRAVIEISISAESEPDALEKIYDDINLDLNNSDIVDAVVIREVY